MKMQDPHALGTNGKKMEVPVRKLLFGAPRDRVASPDAMVNPASPDSFVRPGRVNDRSDTTSRRPL